MLEEDFVSVAADTVFGIFESLNTIVIFGIGAGTWIYIAVIVGFLLGILSIVLPYIIHTPDEK